MRLKMEAPKSLVAIHDKPIIAHTILPFEQSSLVESIILVGHKDHLKDLERIIKKYRFRKVTRIVPGGATRRDSVAAGLGVLDQDTAIVVVHDGARPLVTSAIIETTIRECRQSEAVTVGVPIKPTIKKIDREKYFVTETLDRDEIWEIQTPQTFRKEILLKAHQMSSGQICTDDASLVEKLGVPVKVVAGDYKNIKITTQEDLIIAEAFLRKQLSEK